MNDLMRLVTMLNDAIREVEEQRVLVEKLKGDLEASRAALTMASPMWQNAAIPLRTLKAQLIALGVTVPQ